MYQIILKTASDVHELNVNILYLYRSFVKFHFFRYRITDEYHFWQNAAAIRHRVSENHNSMPCILEYLITGFVNSQFHSNFIEDHLS
jgi:hypothetical protein